jgi:hypothetical protein
LSLWAKKLDFITRAALNKAEVELNELKKAFITFRDVFSKAAQLKYEKISWSLNDQKSELLLVSLDVRAAPAVAAEGGRPGRSRRDGGDDGGRDDDQLRRQGKQ